MSTFELGLGVQTLQILGWALLHSLWIGALIGSIFAALRPVVRDHINLRYWLGVGSLFAFASVEIALIVNALSRALFTVPGPIANFGEAMQVATLNVSATVPFAPQPSTPPFTMFIGFLWLLGVGVSTWRLIRSHRTLQLLARNAQTDTYTDLRRLCGPLLDLLHLHTKVRFAVSELIDVPCVIGLFKPLVLLPAALLARMPQDQLELILLHELSHIKNGDLWINSAQILLEVLMFFHPVVHWISADVRATRERRCDHAVLGLRATPVRYAHALVSLEEFRHEFRGLALAATGGELKSRVRDILAPRARSITINGRRSMRGTVLLSWAAAVVFAGVLSSAFVPRTVTPNVESKSFAPALDNELKADAKLARSPALSAVAPIAAQTEAQRAGTRIETAPAAEGTRQTNARRVLFATPTLSDWQTPQRRAFARLALPKLTRIEPNLVESKIVEANFVEPKNVETNVAEPGDALQRNTQATVPPKLLVRVAPVFVPSQFRLQAFTLSFSLDASGIPQQISLARGRASKSQLLAAQTALAQWRFEPEASARFAGNRVEQSFSFREVTPKHCIPKVGTRICR